MANINTLATAPRLPGTAQGASSTSEFQFQNAAGSIAEITVPAELLNKKRFRVIAYGRVTGGTTTNFTVKLYVGTALGAALFTSGALAVNSTSGSWHIVVEGVLDSTGDKINGFGNAGVNATIASQAVATATADPASALVFGASGQFSASNSGSSAVMDGLEIELL